MPIQTNWEPHVSIIYDLFGKGKTAVRAGYNRYVNGATTTLAAANDPGGNPTLTADLERRERRRRRAVPGHA